MRFYILAQYFVFQATFLLSTQYKILKLLYGLKYNIKVYIISKIEAKRNEIKKVIPYKRKLIRLLKIDGGHLGKWPPRPF